MSEAVTIERDGRIAVVRFDTGKPANALSNALLEDLTKAAQEFHACPETSAVILIGRSDHFCMGADLKDADTTGGPKAPLSQRRIALRRGPTLCEAWEKVDALTICAIEGWCIGGGMALAASCDLRIASETSTLHVPEVERGMNMSWGSIPRFVALIGPARTKRLAALCEKVSAKTALDWGLVDHTAPAGTAFDKALEIARKAAKLPPTALKMVKHDTNTAALALAKTTAYRDLEAFALLQQSDDFKEGVTSFLQDRDPEFTGN